MTPSDLLDRYGGPKRRVQLVAAALGYTPATIYNWLSIADALRADGLSDEDAIPEAAQLRIEGLESRERANAAVGWRK